jgi:hypothetical protein
MNREEQQVRAVLLSQAEGELLKRIQSGEPTKYRLRTTTGTTTYVYCANDALLYTLLTNQPVTLEAEPPTRKRFSVNLAPDSPERLDLWQSLVSDTQALPEVQGMPSRRCPYQHLFQQLDDAARWRAALPAPLASVVELMPLREGWQRARERIRALAAVESGRTLSGCG